MTITLWSLPKTRWLSRLASMALLAATLGSNTVPADAASQRAILSGAAGAELWSLMGQFPYAQEGAGPVLYEVTYSHCPACLAFFRDRKRGNFPPAELRTIFVPIHAIPSSIDEAADVALTRNPAFADAYFARTRDAPPARSSVKAVAAYNRLIALNNQRKQVFDAQGLLQDGFPMFVWRDSSGTEVLMGYGDDFKSYYAAHRGS